MAGAEGWVDKADFLLVRDAPAFFSGLLKNHPKDQWLLGMRRCTWLENGDTDNAIRDLDQYIRMDPNESGGTLTAVAPGLPKRTSTWRSKTLTTPFA